MYNKDDKRRLYWLIDEYIAGNINESIFCDEYYYCYGLELNGSTLNNIEKKAFQELSKVASRFSPHLEDHKLDVHAFSSIEELKKKINEIKSLLHPA